MNQKEELKLLRATMDLLETNKAIRLKTQEFRKAFLPLAESIAQHGSDAEKLALETVLSQQMKLAELSDLQSELIVNISSRFKDDSELLASISNIVTAMRNTLEEKS